MSPEFDQVLDLCSDTEWLDTREAFLRRMTAAAPTTEFYNVFLFRWARIVQSLLFVETGTDRGRSAAHVACGSPSTHVVSIDIDPACSENLRALELPNVQTLTGDSLGWAATFVDGTVDALFLDSLHTYEHLTAELAAFACKVRPGGLIFIDDTRLDAGMERVWREITLPKRDLTPLHFSGFGVVQVGKL